MKLARKALDRLSPWVRAWWEKVSLRAEAVDKPWVWPSGEIVGGLIAGTVFTVGMPWGLITASLGLAVLLSSAYFANRRSLRISALTAQHSSDLQAKDAAIEELEAELAASRGDLAVSEEALDEAYHVVDDIIYRFILRKYLEHGFGADDRITWLLLRGNEAEVVGRHCHDTHRSAVRTSTYDTDYGLIGRAANTRVLQVQTWTELDDGPDYATWQARDCRLPAGADPPTMLSHEYRVAPITDHSESQVLGIIVLESLHTGAHLDALANEFVQDSPDRTTVRDVLQLLAQLPSRERR